MSIAKTTPSYLIFQGLNATQKSNSTPENIDHVDTLAEVVLRPNQGERYFVNAEMDEKGQIFQNDLDGPKKIGQIKPDGNFFLQNGQTGNIFRRDTLILKEDNNTNPFIQTLKRTERNRAIQNSEIPSLKQGFYRQGITGQGIKIGDLNLTTEDKRCKLEEGSRKALMSRIVQDPVWGIAPSAEIDNIHIPNTTSTLNQDMNLDAFKDFFIQSACKGYQADAKCIQEALNRRDPFLKILSIADSCSRRRNYNFCWAIVNNKNVNGSPMYSEIRKEILGSTTGQSMDRQYQAVVDFVDNSLDQSRTYQQAHQTYIETTKKAADAGVMLVVPTGDEHDTLKYRVHVKPGSEMFDAAKSPYVISVGSVNTNQQPGYFSHYNISNFSSVGDNVAWNPTIVAPGSEIILSSPAGNIGSNLTANSTLCGSAFTCGVIALMLQKNPNLKFQQVKDRLETTAIPLNGYNKAEQGAGVLNAKAAISG